MTTRDILMERVHTALTDAVEIPMPVLPALPRVAGDADAQIQMTLTAIEQLGGITQRISNRAALRSAFTQLVEKQNVKRAAVCETDDLIELDVANRLTELGVKLVSPHANKRQLAECDLGITGADAVLPSSGTLALRTTFQQPSPVSLLPRIHLAIFRPTVFVHDLNEMLAIIQNRQHGVLITGPSRTTDIEKVLAIGVHGPKVMYVWSDEVAD